VSSVGFVIGNGTSRGGRYDLDRLKRWGKVIGCNGVHQEATPHAIVAMDEEPKRQLQRMQRRRGFDLITRNTKGYRIEHNGDPLAMIATINQGRANNSGLIALWYALEQWACTKIYLLGFDFFRATPGYRPNELYTGKLVLGIDGFVAAGVEYLARTHPAATVSRVGWRWPQDAKFYAGFRNMQLIAELPAPYDAAVKA
jgi:hypothetical protein